MLTAMVEEVSVSEPQTRSGATRPDHVLGLTTHRRDGRPATIDASASTPRRAADTARHLDERATLANGTRVVVLEDEDDDEPFEGHCGGYSARSTPPHLSATDYDLVDEHEALHAREAAEPCGVTRREPRRTRLWPQPRSKLHVQDLRLRRPDCGTSLRVGWTSTTSTTWLGGYERALLPRCSLRGGVRTLGATVSPRTGTRTVGPDCPRPRIVVASS
jgi:hypothetical protein